MDIIGEFVRRLFWELSPFLELALQHWAMTLVVLLVLVYLAGRHKRFNRHHL